MELRKVFSSKFYDNWDSEEQYKKELLVQAQDFNDEEITCIEDISNEYMLDSYYHDLEIWLEDLENDLDNAYLVVITGTLGLWDGKHEIEPVDDLTTLEAFRKCTQDADDIVVYANDDYSEIKVEAHHHDGCNVFNIKRKAENCQEL